MKPFAAVDSRPGPGGLASAPAPQARHTFPRRTVVGPGARAQTVHGRPLGGPRQVRYLVSMGFFVTLVSNTNVTEALIKQASRPLSCPMSWGVLGIRRVSCDVDVRGGRLPRYIR